MSEKRARVVSLVPSWTETLLSAGANVVGRTRFCIHPKSVVQSIPPLGGTKGMDLQKLIKLRPDFVILDREENKKEMAYQLESEGVRILVSHVTSLQSTAGFLKTLAAELQSNGLLKMSERYLGLKLIDADLFKKNILLQGDLTRMKSNQIQYVIWKDPFMVVGRNTFISEVLKLAQIEVIAEQKYPEVEENELKKSFCFFSSEPYPFKKDFSVLQKNGFQGALIDGEKVSWYGIRNLLFLESCVK